MFNKIFTITKEWNNDSKPIMAVEFKYDLIMIIKNIVNTLIQADLKNYISEWYNKREVSIIIKQDIEFKELPKFVRIFGNMNQNLVS